MHWIESQLTYVPLHIDLSLDWANPTPVDRPHHQHNAGKNRWQPNHAQKPLGSEAGYSETLARSESSEEQPPQIHHLPHEPVHQMAGTTYGKDNRNIQWSSYRLQSLQNVAEYTRISKILHTTPESESGNKTGLNHAQLMLTSTSPAG